jgi:uncharacterized protein YndB with AHSA1/START domain
MSKNNLQIDKENKVTTMERVFDASRELLWKAHVDPELVKQWWGPRSTETIIEKMDVRDGGEWRYIHKSKDEKGQDAEYAFYGVYKEVKEPELIAWTFNFEPIGPGHEITETVFFEELPDGKTKVRTVSHYISDEDLEGMIQSGMEGGAVESWDRLEELTQKQK